MNKTLTVNIGGIVFHIEERAYEIQRKYLEAIKGHFSPADGRDEIMQDIESRIAEMLQERVSNSKQVIVEDDVNAIVNAMGKPEQFDNPDEPSAQTNSSTASSPASAREQVYTGPRRLYRDIDDRVLGGVCAGIGHRFGIDPIWVRLIFVLFAWQFGFSIWLYIILLIVMPKAETNAQKLEMRGEAVNLNNLAREAQSEAPAARGPKSTINRIFDTIGEIFIAILKGVVYFFAIIFGIIGLAILVALFAFLLAIIGVGGLIHPENLLDMFITPEQQLWSIIALIMIVGIPLFLVVYAIIKMIFKIKTSNPWLRNGAIVLMVLGWILGFYMLSDIGRDFSQKSTIRSKVELLPPSNDTLNVDVLRDSLYDNIDWDQYFDNKIGTRMGASGDEKNFYIKENLNFDIEKAEGSNFELVQTITSRGRTREQANENARQVVYNFEQHDNKLLLSDIYPIPSDKRYRGQSVRIVLKVPVGKKVFLADNLRPIIDDIDNVTGTWDWEMTGYTWTMTEKGLECVGCNLKNNKEDFSDSGDESTNISINREGIQIETGKDTIVSKDVKIKVDETGVHIKANDDNQKNK